MHHFVENLAFKRQHEVGDTVADQLVRSVTEDFFNAGEREEKHERIKMRSRKSGIMKVQVFANTTLTSYRQNARLDLCLFVTVREHHDV